MKNRIVGIAFILGILSSGSTYALAGDDLGLLLAVPAEVVFGLKLDEKEIAQMRDKKQLPKECKMNLARLTEGVKLTSKEEFKKWSIANKKDIQKMCRTKKLNKKQCMQMLVRYFTS